jgi:hypothetical protein
MKIALGLVGVGALIGVALGILVSVATDIPSRPWTGEKPRIRCSSIALGAARFERSSGGGNAVGGNGDARGGVADACGH